MNEQRSMGRFLGEEVMYVMRGIGRTETTVPLFGRLANDRDRASRLVPASGDLDLCGIALYDKLGVSGAVGS
jgi:hypothetical protein